MSSHKHDPKSSIFPPRSTGELDEPSERLIEFQDLYHAGPVAERAYQKYVARGYQDGHDVEDWLASEREVEAQQRDQVEVVAQQASRRPQDHDGQSQRR